MARWTKCLTDHCEMAIAVLDQIQAGDIRPNVLTYGTLFKKALDYETAIEMVDQMRIERIGPNEIIQYILSRKRRRNWKKVRRKLMTFPRKLLAKLSGLHIRSIKEILNCPRLPRHNHTAILWEIAEVGRETDQSVVLTIHSIRSK